MLLKPHEHEAHKRQNRLTALVMWPLNAFFRGFNWGFDKLSAGYGWFVGAYRALRGPHAGHLCRHPRLRHERVPQDADRLHPAARRRLSHRRSRSCRAAPSLARTDAVNRRAVETWRSQTPGVAHAVNIVGFSGATFTNAPELRVRSSSLLKPFEERAGNPNRVGARHPAGAVQQILSYPGRPRARRRAAARCAASARRAASA